MMNEKLPKIIASALVEKDNKILLIKETLEDNNEYWIVPGGTVEFGESLADALKREIKEETNLEIEILRFFDFKEAIHTKYDYHTIIFFFLTKPINENNLVLDGKILDAKFFGKEEIKELRLVDTATWILEKYFG